MSVPTKLSDLTTDESTNSPSGSDSIGTQMDDYLRATQAILKQYASKGSNIASAGTLTIPAAGHYFNITGTTGITGINDTWSGNIVVLKFDGIVTLTDSATLILFSSNIPTAAGDVISFVNEESGIWRAISYTKATDDTVTLADTQTLTNKTIVVANNTITTAASGNLAAEELNAALAELDSEKASKTGIETLTNKTIVAANNTITTVV